LALAERNAAANGAAAVRVARLDALGEAEPEPASWPDGMPRRFGLVVVAASHRDDAPPAAVLAAAARHLDCSDPHARVLCCFGCVTSA
jgi:hypothetical protein